MKDYGKGKIYKIVCNKTNLIYIGSTCEPTLARRLAKHVANYKHYFRGNKGHYITCFKIIENGDYDIVLIEDCPCETKDQLHKRERFFIESLKCVNKNIPTRTIKEYFIDNEVKLKAYKEEYNKQHKGQVKEYHEKYREENKDKLKERSHEYYKNNSDKIIDYQKEYRLNNIEAYKQKKKEYRERVKERDNEKFNCECGGKYTHCAISKHIKTKIHQDYLNSIDKL